MSTRHAIPPPPQVPTYAADWQQSVDDRLDDLGERLESMENDAACLRRTEAKVDSALAELVDMRGEQREIKGLLLHSLDREAAREPTQERDLGNLKTELAKTSASSGRKWGAIAGGIVTAIAAVIELLR